MNLKQIGIGHGLMALREKIYASKVVEHVKQTLDLTIDKLGCRKFHFTKEVMISLVEN